MNIINLNNIKKLDNKSKKRVGRGHASNGGKSGRGSDGQKARESINTEGGQFRSYLRIRKKGFINHNPKRINILNLKQIFFMLSKYQDKKYFSINDLIDYFKLKNYKIKIIGSNLLENQLDLILQNNYTIECHSTSKRLIDLNLIKIVNVSKSNI